MPTSSAHSASPSVAPGVYDLELQSLGPDVVKNVLLVQVVNALEIDPGLTHDNDKSLRMWYKKFNAWNSAYAKLAEMKNADKWTLPSIGKTELINIFGKRGYWHSHITKAFNDIQKYELMVKWLERGENDTEPSDLEVWHLEKSVYRFKDLTLWKQAGTLDKEYQEAQLKKQKEKGKAKAKESKSDCKEKGRRNHDGSEDEVQEMKKASGSKASKPALRSHHCK